MVSVLGRNYQTAMPQTEYKTLKCDSDIGFDYIDILASTNQRKNTLLTLEALQIKDIKPSINTKDNFIRSRALRIIIKVKTSSI